MQTPECKSCLEPKAHLNCGLCGSAVCKKCAEFVDGGSFAFSPEGSVKFAHGAYCPSCFDSNVAAPLAAYNEDFEKAKGIIVFSRDQGKESRRYKKNAPAVHVEDCDDSREALLRLAFLAVRENFNGLVNVDLKSKKVKINSYTTTKWSGSGIPTQINEEALARVEHISTWVNQT
jgi:hypothetical protein